MEGILFIRDLAVVMVIAGGVGWLFQRMKLSVVVGYLLAGIIIGPYTPPFQLVSDLDRVQTLSQVGLVFLIFSIGLGLSFAKLQRLGSSVAVATAIGAILIFNTCRLFGFSLGWTTTESMFLAGMLMVSSSAIISKVLEEQNVAHQRSGQLALGVTVLEDIVAVLMLTLLASAVQIGQAETESLWRTIRSLSAFIVFLIFLSLLFIPRLLKKMTQQGSSELRVVVVTGVVLMAAYMAVKAGYSLALGAFILGVVIAGTRHRDEVEKSFEGLRNIFGAVFFVAIGMLFDIRLLLESWGLILMVSALVLIARPVACAIGLLAVGNSSRNAMLAGVMLTPIGEFSFVIAQLGIATKAVPETFYAVAVGVSLITSIVGPLLSRYSQPIANWVENHEPRWMQNWITFYHHWLSEMQGRRSANIVWRLTSKRILQTILQILFASAVILAANPLYDAAVARLGENWIFPQGAKIIFWTVFGVLLLGPIITIWRNIEALVMIYSEALTQTHPRRYILRPLLQTVFKTTTVVLLGAWLLLLLPFGFSVLWAFAVVVGLLVLLGVVFWRRLVLLHSKLEIELRQQIQSASTAAGSSGLAPAFFHKPLEWDLQVDEITLTPQTDHAGRMIKDLALRTRFGCSIVGIDRQGFLIANPAADEALFPGDKLLLLGSEKQLGKAEQFLRSANTGTTLEIFEDLTTETISIPENSPQNGKTLVELDLIRRFGVQVCGIQRGSTRILVPAGVEHIQSSDRLLVLGSHDKIQECRDFFHPASVVS